jgi:hypothetical protein
MAQVIVKKSLASKITRKVGDIFVIEPVTFSSKRRINFRGIGWLLCSFLALFCLIVFLVPAPEEQTRTYSERRSEVVSQVGGNSTLQPQTTNPLSPAIIRPSLSSPVGGIGESNASAANSRNTSMIIAHDNDLSTTLPPGTKFWVQLTQSVTVTGQAIPVIGTVLSSVESGNSIAIPEETRIFGEATLDADSERASITWKSILFPDGRSKTLSGLALWIDNQAGVEGAYHSNAVTNTAGQMISHFMGGFAEGAISHGMLGASPGGLQNGLLQGTADTAKDRAGAWSEDLKKPRAWIELEAGVKFQVILSQPFIFRDPGGVN